jgi:hypothetical protein
MDLYVKLQGLKYNFRKVQGCFYKIPSAGYFLKLMNYFPWTDRAMDQVHNSGAWGLRSP